ncbi:hypothetical protein [Corynebacterium glutamicum]|uniref:hypothetical protein n=1 Tax=Corynebacterium glutamicum TaxID=1718 RepID=UPI0009448C35|nr:hypothetical protein [Corynebacterium glutamicum]OKX85125.1 hypothetical protein AUO95_00910 [Corynebacterium glutamicum]
MRIFGHSRPWLRYLEGTEGNQAGGSGGQDAGASTDAGAGDAAKVTGGDQGSGDRGDQDGSDAAARLTAAVQAQAKASEPDFKPESKAEGKKSEPTMAELMDMLQEQQKTITTLQQASVADAAEKRAALAVEVAKAAKLPESMATRLAGNTREQLEADATELAKSLGTFVRDPAQGQGAGTTTGMSMTDSINAFYAGKK